jgi:hypothetical protein
VSVLVLVVSIATLTALAYASPPDPSWIAGWYDDVDFDDVVNYLTSSASLIDDVGSRDLLPLELLATAVPRAPEDAAPLVPRSSGRPRAPPAS